EVVRAAPWHRGRTLPQVRIRYVLFNAYGVGGTVRSVVNQANALCDTHDAEIASLYRSRDHLPFAVDPRVPLVPLTDRTAKARPWWLRPPNPFPHRYDFRFRPWDPVADLALVRYLRRQRDGVLVTTRPGLSLLAARLAPRRLVRVAQDHRSHESYAPAVRDTLVRAYRRLDAVAVLSTADLDFYRRALAGSRTRVVHIPNAVPEPALPPAALESKVLVAAGRLRPEKGFDLLLEAFAIVAARHPDWQLWIFGGGPERDRLAAQVQRLGLAGRAHLKGATPHLDRQLAEASAFVLSSRHEGLPMVLLEAMAAGLPVVAFDCGAGTAEVVVHGRNGLLVPAGDVPALAAAVADLIGNPDRPRAMGAAARRDARRYAVPAVRRQWEELFAA